MEDLNPAVSDNQLPISSEPLWKKFPTVDSEGKCLLDFMMIFPGFKKLTSEEIHNRAGLIYDVLNRHSHSIVHASLNLKKNILMISVKPDLGIHLIISREVQEFVPEAKLVSHM